MRHLASICALAIALFVCGCATTSSTGTPAIEAARVAEIQKGVTTKKEIVDAFGAPVSSQIMGDGKRMLIFASQQTTMRRNDGLLTPVVGVFMKSTERNTTRMQNLQVILRADDVVEDYEFSDQTSDMSSEGSVLGSSAKTKTTDNTKNN